MTKMVIEYVTSEGGRGRMEIATTCLLRALKRFGRAFKNATILSMEEVKI